MNFETPSAPSPEKPAKPYEAFLSKDLRHLNGGLSKAFAFFDLHAKDLKDSSEIDDARRAGSEALVFFARYGDVVLERALQGGDADQPLSDEDKVLLADYRTFLETLDHPELRPRLLSKLAYMSPGETPEAQAETWPERQAFSRFMTEFYGHEKVLTTETDENGIEQKKGFLKLEGQADLVEAWNLQANWGFTERQFDEIRDQIPAIRERMKNYEDEPLIAPILTPYLQDEYRTFSALRTLLTVPQEKNYVNEVYKTPTEENLQLLKGIKHQSGLKFEIVGLGDNTGEKPSSIRGKNSPHASILAAAALHPEWVQAMDGENIPYANVPGYQVTVPGHQQWRRVPTVYFSRDDREVLLGAHSVGIANGLWSVPSARE